MVTLFIDPALTRARMHKSRIAQQQSELAAVRSQLPGLEQQMTDPDAAVRAQRDALQRQLAGLDESIKGMQLSLVPAERVTGLLEDVLTRNPRLQLVSVRTLPLALLVPGPADRSAAGPAPASTAKPRPHDKPTEAQRSVFKHGFEITVHGTYADLHDYLARLEQLPWRMFWSRVKLDTEEYPRLVMSVTLYTLSLDKAWLKV
jgi:MSHA biogenesis protein MshJ